MGGALLYYYKNMNEFSPEQKQQQYRHIAIQYIEQALNAQSKGRVPMDETMLYLFDQPDFQEAVAGYKEKVKNNEDPAGQIDTVVQILQTK